MSATTDVQLVDIRNAPSIPGPRLAAAPARPIDPPGKAWEPGGRLV